MPRHCSICTMQPNALAPIEHAIAENQPIAHVARRYAVSEDALGRHVRHHLGPEIRSAAAVSRSVELGGLAQRVAAVADDARAARQAAQATGKTSEALRAGDAELRAISALADRLGIDSDEASIAIQQRADLMDAIAQTVFTNPDVAAPIVAALSRAGADSLADSLDDLAVRSRAALTTR